MFWKLADHFDALIDTAWSIMLRSSPAIAVTAVSWILLGYTEQGQDFIVGAKDDFWQTSQLLAAIMLLSLVVAYCTVYLLSLPPEWDSSGVVDGVFRWWPRDKKSEGDKKAADHAEHPLDPADHPLDRADSPDLNAKGYRILRWVVVGVIAYFVSIPLFYNLWPYLLGLSNVSKLLLVVVSILGGIVVWLAVVATRAIEPGSRFKNITLLGCFGILVLCAAWPVLVGRWLGSAFTLVVVLSLWLLLVCASVGHWRARGWKRSTLLVVVFSVFWSIAAISDLVRDKPATAAIRCFEGHCKPPATDALPTLDKAFENWRSQHQGKKPALLLVAAAGGGARASYWTSIVLGRLTDLGRADGNQDAMRMHLFLGSGVSGGALGITVHAAMMASDTLKCGGPQPAKSCVHYASEFGSTDFLAANVAALLTGDLFNAAIPGGIFNGRDVALEKAWETQWTRTMGNSALSGSFSSLWGPRTLRAPNLVLNATSTRTGERIVASNIRAASFLKSGVGPRLNLAEKINLPVSAAVHASARFPYVDPPGAVRSADDKPDQWDVVADGGYYDNFGAATLLDVLDALEKHAGGQNKLKDLVRPVMLLITSDPTRGMAQDLDAAFDGDKFSKIEDCKVRSRVKPPDPNPSWWTRFLEWADTDKRTLAALEKQFAPADPLEPAGPFGTMMKARARSGSVFPVELRKRVHALEGEYFHFAMDDTISAPLGWVLSAKARANLDSLLNSKCHSTQLQMIIEALKAN